MCERERGKTVRNFGAVAVLLSLPKNDAIERNGTGFESFYFNSSKAILPFLSFSSSSAAAIEEEED